jgi:hypothetical protein
MLVHALSWWDEVLRANSGGNDIFSIGLGPDSQDLPVLSVLDLGNLILAPTSGKIV